jgi:hypothetical protein
VELEPSTIAISPSFFKYLMASSRASKNTSFCHQFPRRKKGRMGKDNIKERWSRSKRETNPFLDIYLIFWIEKLRILSANFI